MNSVKIKKEKLLEEIKKNKTKHAHEYSEAVSNYQTTLIEKLKALLTKAKKAEKDVIVDAKLSLIEPHNHLKDYDRIIAMLEMSVEDTIELSQNDFDRYVLDNWEWRQAALIANTIYKK